MAVVPAGALDGALPRHHVATQEALRLLRDPASSRTWLHDPRTHEAVELMPPPRGALWDIHVVNAEGLAIISSKTEDNWTNSFLSYDVWSVGRDLYVQPRDAGTGAFLVDFVAGSKDMVCAISPRRQNLRVDVDVCPRMIQGARCWWEMPQFWHFLSVDASGTAARLVAARALRWEALTLSLGLPRPHIRRRHEWQRGALPDRTSMHRMLPCTSASMHAILTIIRTAAAGVRRHGGLPASLAQDPAERFLESLLRDLYWTSATIRINVDAASELIAGPCIGHCPLFLPLGRCVVDVSALADALRGRSSEARAFRHSRGRAPVEKAESTMQQHVLLVRLLGAGPQLHWLTKQFLWQAGDLLDGIVARTLDTPAVLRAPLAIADTQGTPASALLPKAKSVHWRNRRPRLQRYFMACREHFDGARSLSCSIDASRVGRKQVFLLALALPDNCSAWAPPQAGRDAGASSPSALTRADGSTRHARARSSRGTGGHASTGGCEQTCPCASASACACAGAGDFSGTRADPRATRCVAAALVKGEDVPRKVYEELVGVETAVAECQIDVVVRPVARIVNALNVETSRAPTRPVQSAMSVKALVGSHAERRPRESRRRVQGLLSDAEGTEACASADAEPVVQGEEPLQRLHAAPLRARPLRVGSLGGTPGKDTRGSFPPCEARLQQRH